MQRQHFDCVAKRQTEFISFYKNLKLLDPPKNQAHKGGATTTSSAASKMKIPKKKRGSDNNSTNQAKKNATKY
eukprot:7461801-Ditylum_brightwellii.AAC.1